MVIDKNGLDHTDFMLDGERISEVEEFVYLGSKITKECSCRTEVRRRLAMARTATLNMTSISAQSAKHDCYDQRRLSP